jgi:hypothetical protein
VPVFWGRGVFTYNLGFLPKRKPINVVTGEPVSAQPFLDKGLSGDALIDAVHTEYLRALKALFDKYKNRTDAGRARTESMVIVE